MANALRIQNRWNEAIAILENHRSSFPAEIRPYADMTLLLGFERSGRYAEALNLASELEKDAPEWLLYFIAYAQYRMQENRNADGAKRASENMLSAADTRDRRIAALTRLIRFPGDRQLDHALELLELQPANRDANAILAASPRPWSPAANLAMGVHAHRRNDYRTAISLLSDVQQGPGWRRATYYRARSLERTNRYVEALNLFENLALSGNAYAENSVRRIATIAGRAERANATAMLRNVVNERKGRVQSRAMISLLELVSGDEARRLENGLIQAYPDLVNTVRILWRRGWDAWNANDFATAAAYWKRICAPGSAPIWEARALYWIGAAQMSMNQFEEAEETYATLVRRHPISFYTFFARPGAITLRDGIPAGLMSEPTLLEDWGFVYHARLKMQRPGASGRELFRALELSEWLGEEAGPLYRRALVLTRYFMSGSNVYRRGLEFIYPRPFRELVDAASAEFGVENNLVWAIMRQESAFDPRATSRAGAAGLMQLMPATAQDEANRIRLRTFDIYDVADNIRMGVSHLAWLSRSFSRLDWVMAAYNAGSGNARRWLADGGRELTPDFWIERITFHETRDYIQRVAANLEIYRMLYGTAP